MTPVSVQLVSVALVVPSYGLLAAATVGVTVTAVIAAVVVAVVLESGKSPAAAPVRIRPLTVTVLPLPTLADPNAAVPLQLTTSAPITPVSVQLESVTAAGPAYGLVSTTAVGVTKTAVIAAVGVAAGNATGESPPAPAHSVRPPTGTG